MRFDLSGAELFLNYLDGRIPAQDVLEHPAYLVVRKHAETFSSALTEREIEDAQQGRPSNFYGLKEVAKNTPRIRAFLETLRVNQTVWSDLIRGALQEFFPDEELDLPIYPIIGYDKGIGLNGAVCLNINYVPYLDEPFEFLAYIIHECVHVVYERHHHVPPLAEVVSPAQWRSYFALWTHNEGYAVYVPLHFRQAHGLLDEPDYRALSDPKQAAADRSAFANALRWLNQDEPRTQDEYLETCFGSRRLTYRVGCGIIKRIEMIKGMIATQRAFYLDQNQFIEEYQYLLA